MQVDQSKLTQLTQLKHPWDIKHVAKRHEYQSQHTSIKGSYIETYHAILAQYFKSREIKQCNYCV